LRRRLSFLGRDATFARTAVLDLLGKRFVPDPFRPRVFVAVFGEIFSKPAAAIRAGFHFKITEHFEIRARLELMNLVLTLREDRQRRRLDPTNWGELETAGRASIECRHGAGPVDTNQ